METKQPMDVAAWLEQHGDAVVAVMYPDGDAPDDFDVVALVKREDRLVFKLSSHDRDALVKAFCVDPEEKIDRTDRELLVQLALRGTNLVPDIRNYDKANRWVLSEWISGDMLERLITAENAVDYAYKLGAWFAEYTKIMETHGGTKPSDWYTYLQYYSRVMARLDYSDHEEFLSSMPIKTRLIAKNDAYLGNFMVSDNGRMVGIDFEKAQLKPYGWDILVTARILLRKFPNKMMELTEALVNGWGQGTDCMDMDEFLKLTRIFAASSAFIVEEDYALQRAEMQRAEGNA